MNYEKITLLGGAVVTVDLTKPSLCKRCGKTIWWVVTRNLKNMPITKDANGNYVSHFYDCPYATQFRRTSGEDRLDDVARQQERESWK